jgi:integrase
MPREIAGRWYTDFRYQGKRIRQIMPEARTRTQAERLEARIRDQMFEGIWNNRAAETVFIEFAEKVWLQWSREHKRSWRSDECHFKTFRAFFGQKTFAEISPLLIEKFKRERLHTPTLRGERAPASVNRELEILSKIFRLAVQQKIIRDNPVSEVRRFVENNQRTRFLTLEEEERLLAAVALWPTLRAIIVLAIHTGMRQGEILKLRWCDLDFSAEKIHVRETKSGHNRVIPMTPTVKATLAAMERVSEWIFPGAGRTGHLVEIKKGWSSALKEAGIENLRFHDLRHTTGSRLAAAGHHPNTIREVLGHQDLRTTQRYTHAMDDQKRAAILSLETFGQKYVKSLSIENDEQALSG